MLATDAFVRVMSPDYRFDTVLDVCDGTLEHTRLFQAAGKTVTTVDIRQSSAYLNGWEDVEDSPFDVVWSSHVLQHAPNSVAFLQKLAADCKDGGIIAVTVPIAKTQIFGGDVSSWTAGQLIYQLVLAGLNCSNVRIKTYAGNISAIITKHGIKIPKLMWEPGDLGKLQPFLPSFFGEGTRAEIASWNW